MKLETIISFFAFFFLVNCNGQIADKASTIKYIASKSEFDKKLVNFFPAKNITFPFRIINSKNEDRNDIAFMLYEYDIDTQKINSINVLRKKAIAHYKSNDTCLLIVNRFQTVKSRKYDEDAEIKDSTKINQDCFNNLYPIPNFIDYEEANEDSDLKLKGNFDIYVLEAKSGNYFNEFKLQPNPQMPNEWKNGYSKGIAIEKDKKTIIYWGIIW